MTATENKSYERNLNYKLMELATQNAQRDYYIKEQEPGLIDLYSKDGHEVGELIEIGFKSIEDVARYIDILSGIKNHKLFPDQPIGRTNRDKFIGTCIMLDASAQEYLKDLLESDYKIWPDSFHSFIIAEDRGIVDKLIKKYHLTEMRRGIGIFDTHNVYNGDIVDYVSRSTFEDDEYSGPKMDASYRDLIRYGRRDRADNYSYRNNNYNPELEESIFKQLNKIDDEESLNMNEGFMDKPFGNNIDNDILDLIDCDYSNPVTNNSVKCSKSVVPNALYYVSQGEDVYFCLGNIGLPFKPITHCWVEHNGKITQTHVSSPNVKLIKKFSVKLIPNDIEGSKNKILELIKSILSK